MVIREDLVASAITFLHDPSVANSPLDKRIAFLQSKNLTPEEIDASLARTGEPGQVSNTSNPANYGYQPQAPPRPNYGYQPSGYWQQPPPPELPKRDWRDYFIMATVMSGLSYGVYFIANRYIVPLVAPPTPPQLEQDKAAIDQAFNRAFTLLEQLSTDTAALKASEDSRKERLDAALAEVENVTLDLKLASRRRDEEGRRIGDEVNGLKTLIPEAMKAQREATDNRLLELNSELKSLKTLVGNRMAAGPGVTKPPINGVGASLFSSNGSTSSPANGGMESTSSVPTENGAATQSTDVGAGPDRKQNSSPYGRVAGARGGIPAWQMAAAKKSQESTEARAAVESGTATDATATAS